MEQFGRYVDQPCSGSSHHVIGHEARSRLKDGIADGGIYLFNLEEKPHPCLLRPGLDTLRQTRVTRSSSAAIIALFTTAEGRARDIGKCRQT